MARTHLLTQTSLCTLLLTSSILFLLALPPSSQHARASSLSSEPRCKFPHFLQTRRNKQWMMNQSVAFATFDVNGGTIFARHGTCVRSHDYIRHSGRSECTKLNYTLVCMEKRAGNKYLVRHMESDFKDKFVCVEFLPRGVSVVQVKMSQIQGQQFVSHMCEERYMHVGAWPWVSEERYRSAPVPCPFSGGFNLQLKYASPPPARRNSYYGSQAYYGPSYYDRITTTSSAQDCADTSTAPIRLESDCITGEGVVLHFKHQSCLPAGSSLPLHQRALCMATWRSGRELFAMLRADNNDRAFFCLRVSLSQAEDRDPRDPRDRRTEVETDSPKMDEVMLFLGWACPTSSYADSVRGNTGTFNSVSPLVTPHMALTVLDQRVITEPCSDEVSLCHNHPSFCQHFQCMRTCGNCSVSDTKRELASSSYTSKKSPVFDGDRFSVRFDSRRDDFPPVPEGERGTNTDRENHPDSSEDKPKHPIQIQKQKCTFPQSIRGTWLRRTSDGNDEEIVITDSTFTHPRLGHMECVTFTSPGSRSAPLQRVLWSRYKNGCYPRFTCLHFNTPAKSVMRYRLADMQLWPLSLSDVDICSQRHFMQPPDMYQPEDKYTVRSWEVVRRAGHIHKLACILPHYVPKIVSFRDKAGRSGCLAHATYYSPRTVSTVTFPLPPTHYHTPRPGSSHDVTGTSPDVHHRKVTYDARGNSHDANHRKTSHDVRDKGRDVYPRTTPHDVRGNNNVNHRKSPHDVRGSSHDANHRKGTHDVRYNSGDELHRKTPHNDRGTSDDVNQRHDVRLTSHDETRNETYYEDKGSRQEQEQWKSDWNKGGTHDGFPDQEHNLMPPDNRQHNGNKNEGLYSSNRKDLSLTDRHFNKVDNNRKHQDNSNKETDNVNFREDWFTNHHPGTKTNYNQPDVTDYWGENRNGIRTSKTNYSKDADEIDWNSQYYSKKWRVEQNVKHTESYSSNKNRDSNTHFSLNSHNNNNKFTEKDNIGNNKDWHQSHNSYRQHRYNDRYRRMTKTRIQVTYQCLAVMTYVDSYKSLLTVTSGNPDEILCWLVVNSTTVVIIKTSSCNSPTARQILDSDVDSALHEEHVHDILHLHQGERDCGDVFPADPVRPAPIESIEESDSRASVTVYCGVLYVLVGVCFILFLAS